MDHNLLDAPIARLQALQKPSLPWSFLARKLISLLKSYSTGLSFEIAADEISAAWRLQKSSEEKNNRASFRTGTITHIALGPPEVWLVRLSDSTLVAWFAHSNFHGACKAGTIISFAESDVVDLCAKKGSSTEYVELARQTFRDLPASGEILTVPAASREAEPVRKPDKPSQEARNSQSPVDVTKFPTRTEQHAITPSQVHDPNDPTVGLKQLLLPTSKLFFELDSVDHKAIGLLEPPEAFSLQRIWNERSLTPSWIYGEVVQVQGYPEIYVRLQDPPKNPNSQQPSVLCRLPEELQVLTKILGPGALLLLKSPLVQPTGSSFDVVCSPQTCFYYRTNASDNHPGVADVDEDSMEATPRPAKRPRVDSDFSVTSSAVTTRHLAALSSPEHQSEFALHARVVAFPKHSEPYMTLVECEDDVIVKVAGSEMARKAASLQIGDEVLFQDVVWVPSSSSLGSQMPAGWVSSVVDSLSTMTGFLHSSFARRTKPISTVRTKRSSITPQAFSSAARGTVQVNVRILDVSVSLEEKKLHLVVCDAIPEPLQDVTPVNLQNGKSIGHAVTKKCEIAVRTRCFEDLFRTPDAEMFWDNNPLRRISECLTRLKAQNWMMTIFWDSSASQIPVLCACVPGIVKSKKVL